MSAITAAVGSSARVLPIDSHGFAGSSINVIAGLQNSMITERGIQYAAFYAADGSLLLARRKLGGDTWETQRSGFSGDPADAHRSVALAVDGAGFLHLAWNHHVTALHYARSVAPGSLQFGPPQSMTGLHEDRVTYPAFLRLPDGDLLCFYRDGASGRGNLVLNRYRTAAATWTQLHANLLDGEGHRNAYASAIVDAKGVLHLAWVWRESPDVATNHDLAYARSSDGGVTWTTIAGSPLTLPIRESSADYALRIGPNRSLMNPPSLAADADGHPYLADYWCPDGSDIPQYHLVRYDGTRWQVQAVTQRTTAFALAGTATKHPPISRAVLLLRQPWQKPAEIHLVYRDDERGGRVVVTSCGDAAHPVWTTRELTADSLGAWEPSLDPDQWQRFAQLHMLVQSVQQRDGDDREADAVPGSPVASLIWSPFTASMGAGEQRDARQPSPAAGVDAPLVASAVLSTMEGVADWQIAHPSSHPPAGWENAPFYIGTLALAQLSTSPRFHDAMLKQAEANHWAPAPRVYHADDMCVIQAYAELYRRDRDPRMLGPSRERLDAILAHPPTTTLDWGLPGALDRWSWCDALFMGPTSWLMLFEATGDRRYLDFMNHEWWATVDALYVPSDHFFARDQSFLDLREPNGRRLYWSRGNGWVAAGLARVLDLFPHDHPDYPRYVALYRDMMDAVLAAQQPDGLWRPGLLDPVAHPARETSGSSFYTFALAWGINRGLLDRARVEPAVRRGWNALTTCVTPEGKLEQVQPIGAAPEGFDPHHTEPFGVGAFLLAGSEVYRLASTGAADRPPSATPRESGAARD